MIVPRYSPANVKISIEDKNGAVVAVGSIAEEGTAVLEIANPELWNTENLYLYQLILETENEVIVDHIALRKIEIKDQVIYLNGQKIKFRGVNRHDSDPVTGFTISVEQITTDLTLMKQHNFNAIRSSHYPNAPFFYFIPQIILHTQYLHHSSQRTAKNVYRWDLTVSSLHFRQAF